MRQSITELEKRLGHSFIDPNLLKQALTHRRAEGRNNERSEFLGDAALNFIIAEQLYATHEDLHEGSLTRLRAVLVRKETLVEIARSVELGDHLILGPGELRTGARNRDSILADAFEAVGGAIFLDAGIEQCKSTITNLFKQRLLLVRESEQKDPKTRLQEYLQARQLALPVYDIIEAAGKPHRRSFKVQCHLPAFEKTTVGLGQSRRSAEQLAATEALILLGVN